MSGERAQHLRPQLFVSLVARVGIDGLERVSGLVEISERQLPRNHGVAAYLFVDAETCHELHPFVERGVVERPCAVGLLHPRYHVRERVVGLSVPRTMGYRNGYRLATAVGIQLHYGAHESEVLVAERLHVVVTSHGVRVLPQVKVELPVLGRRQRAVLHLHVEAQRRYCPAVGLHLYGAAVCAGLGVARHAYAHPSAAGGVGLHVESGRQVVDRVGHEKMSVLILVAAAARVLSVLLQFVRHYISHECRPHVCLAYC